MTDQELEERLRAFYRVEIDDRTSAPQALRTQNATLAQAAATSRRSFLGGYSIPRIMWSLPLGLGATAAVVTLAIGVGLVLRPPSEAGPDTEASTAPPSPAVTPAATRAPKVPLGGGLILVISAQPDPDAGTFDVFSLDAGTGEQTLLGTLPRRGFGTYDVQWGADRKHVLITTGAGSGPVALETLTETARDLTFIVCCKLVPDAGVLSLSPQSNRIAAALEGSYDVPGCGGCADVTASVIIVDVDGSGSRSIPLPDGTLGRGPPSWSPDGSAVVVVGCRPCNNAFAYASAAGEPLDRDWAKAKPTAIEHGRLFILPVDGSRVREPFDATETTYGIPAWSPDGTTIAVPRFTCAAGEHAPYCEPATSELVTMTVDDGQPTVVADQAGDLAWSPDGRRLTFGNASGLFVMDADGSHLTKVVERNTREPRWSPDGEWLVFRTYDAALFQEEGPWIVPAGGGEPRLLGAYGASAW